MEMEKELYLKENFLRLLENGANLNKLCDFTAKCINTPVALTLTTRTIIAKSSNYTPDLVDEYVSSLDLCPAEEVKRLNDNVQSLLLQKRPVVELYPYLKHRRINCGCFRADTMLAVLDCPIVTRTLPEDALEIVAMAAPVFLIAMQLNSLLTPTTLNPMQVYLSELLHGGDSDHYQQLNLYNSPLETIQSWQIIWCSPFCAETLLKLKSGISGFCSQHPQIWYLEYENGIVILLNAERNEYLKKMGTLCQGNGILAVSNPYPNLNRTEEHLRIAQTAARLAAFEENEDTLVFVQEYKLHIYFLSYKQNNQLDLTNPIINQVKEYDEEHGSEYFPTLRAYLFYKRDFKEMARHLHVHKNTVAYRMQRICELFHLDFKDCRTITNLYFSLFSDFI